MLLYFVVFFLILVVGTLALSPAVRHNISDLQFSTFECGFETSIRVISYSLQFFTLALSFIAFDFEIFLLLPFVRLIYHAPSGVVVFLSVVGILTLLLFIEMTYIDWK